AGLHRLERDQLAVELVEHLEDVRLGEDRAEVGPARRDDRRRRRRKVDLLLVDVVLVGLRGLRDEAGRTLHTELEAHCPLDSAADAGLPSKVARPFDGTASRSWVNQKRCVRPGPWMRSSLNGFSTDGRLTMNESALVWRPRVGS